MSHNCTAGINTTMQSRDIFWWLKLLHAKPRFIPKARWMQVCCFFNGRWNWWGVICNGVSENQCPLLVRKKIYKGALWECLSVPSAGYKAHSQMSSCVCGGEGLKFYSQCCVQAVNWWLWCLCTYVDIGIRGVTLATTPSSTGGHSKIIQSSWEVRNFPLKISEAC